MAKGKPFGLSSGWSRLGNNVSSMGRGAISSERGHAIDCLENMIGPHFMD